MRLLKDILYGVRLIDVSGGTNIAVESIAFDSRKVVAYSMFVATRGTQVDGHDFIEMAIEKGAIAIVCEELPVELKENVTYIHVNNSAEALGIMASNYYDNPTDEIKLIGITGTNGKTTTATLLYDLFKSLGYKVGLLSTVVNKVHNDEVKATHTTPNALELNALLVKMIEAGCEYCFMEVSSHAVDQGRVAGLDFKGAVFTNITHDHLDYHKTFDNYIAAKKGFFDMLKPHAFAILNRDDYHWESMVQDCRADIKTFGVKTMADFKAKIIENQFSGLQLNVGGSELWTKLIGGFNAYNVLAIYAVAEMLGEDTLTILTNISKLNSVEGRFDYVKTGNDITAIVDYAHTPDALKNVLSTIADIRTGNENVITVVGCGGDRDKTKRPLMAKIACEYSEHVILTSDNPRSEDPEVILEEMLAGVDGTQIRKTISITNRKEAIKTACKMAQEGDIILVAGKGHEKYQIIKDEVLPFDDMQIVNETLKMLEK